MTRSRYDMCDHSDNDNDLMSRIGPRQLADELNCLGGHCDDFDTNSYII